MEVVALQKFINSDSFVDIVNKLYCDSSNETIERQRIRYLRVLDKAVNLYGDGDYHFISSPGRIEVCGNHTDHQRGTVVAAAINLDNLCVVKKSDDNKANFCDEVFKMNEVDLDDLTIREEEKGNTKSIIRGVAKRYKELKFNIGGFKAYQDMNVLVGSGLSSSACFEILITEIYNYLYNADKIDAKERAKISQWVENNYFGKPCGLMDQMAISVGDFVVIDFKEKDNPNVKKYEFSFNDFGYQVLVINTKADHANLTDEYASIPNEMKMVSEFFGKEVLSQVDEKIFLEKLKELREKIKNDRAVLRAYHYFTENDRVKEFEKALNESDINKIISIIKESGLSSYNYLQNVYAASIPKVQGVSIAIAISDKMIGNLGVCRVQGGGFAGTIQVIIKTEKVNEFIDNFEKIYGSNTVRKVNIRKEGTKVVM